MSRQLGRFINTGDDLKSFLLYSAYRFMGHSATRQITLAGFARSPWRMEAPEKPSEGSLKAAILEAVNA